MSTQPVARFGETGFDQCIGRGGRVSNAIVHDRENSRRSGAPEWQTGTLRTISHRPDNTSHAPVGCSAGCATRPTYRWAVIGQACLAAKNDEAPEKSAELESGPPPRTGLLLRVPP
jgi:hypothetical protein